MYDVTYEEILERMLARVSDKFDKRKVRLFLTPIPQQRLNFNFCMWS